MELLIGWGIIWGLACGIVAANRGRSGIGWFFLGFFFSFIAVIVLALIPAQNALPPQVVVQLQGLPDTTQSGERPLEISKAGGPPPSTTTGIWSILLLISMLALGAYLSSKDTKPSSAVVAPTPAPVAAPIPAATWADGAPPPPVSAPPPDASQVKDAPASTKPAPKQRAPNKRNLQIIVE